MKTFALSSRAHGDNPTKIVDIWCEWKERYFETEDNEWLHPKERESLRARKAKWDAIPGRAFYVINGDWWGHFDEATSTIICHTPLGDKEWKGDLVWEGEVPKREYKINDWGSGRDYNTAMAWIREQLELDPNEFNPHVYPDWTKL